MIKVVADYYPNAICFENKKEVRLYGNWFEEKYNNILIAIEACTGEDYCKPMNEIIDYVRTTSFFTVAQTTTVDKNTYHDSNSVDHHFTAKNGNNENQ